MSFLIAAGHMATLMLTILDYILGGFVGACTIAVAVLLDAILQTSILEADREAGR